MVRGPADLVPGSRVGDRLTLRFEVPRDGRYELTLVYTKAWDFGIQSRTLDSETLGEPYDHWTPGGVAIDRQSYGVVELTVGMHPVLRGIRQAGGLTAVRLRNRRNRAGSAVTTAP